MESFKKRTAKATKGIGQRDTKEATNDCFVFDSWFSSNNSAEAMIDIGADMIGMVQTNTKVLFKEII